MKKNEEKEQEQVKCLTPVKVEDFADGNFVKLANVDDTRKILSDAVESAKGVVVTRENYKKEAAAVERRLREFRYELQKVKKSNNSIVNKVKSSDGKMYDDLIAIVSP